MRPSAILFDLDDTILRYEGGDYRKLWRACVEEHCHHFDGLAPRDLFNEIQSISERFWRDPERHRRGRLDMRAARQQFVREAARSLGSPNDQAANELANRYHERRESEVVPFEGALETLEYFKKSPIKTALLTNGGTDTQRRKIESYQLDRFFDCILIEGEFGKGKPNPDVYLHLTRELGVSERESWIVGDNLEWEVRVPQRLGFYAIWNDYLGRGLPRESEVVPDRIVKSIHELIDPATGLPIP